MGYGIKLLITQRASLSKALRGREEEWLYKDQLIMEADMVDKLQDDLFRISGCAIEFISTCKTLFKIYEDDKCDCDNIYIWRDEYTQMHWDNLKAVIEPLVDKYLDLIKGEDGTEKDEIIDVLEKLINVSDITTKFQIN